jgi:hypothetical protein
MVDDDRMHRILVERESARELRDLSSVELDVRHDVFVGQLNRPASARIAALIQRQEYISRIDAYLMERKRRETASQGERMEALSRSLNRLTVIIAVATIIGVGRRFQRVDESERGRRKEMLRALRSR